MHKLNFDKLSKLFVNKFGSEPDFKTRAPGRINLIGEHTDYNNGFVFPAAIDKSMYFGFRENGTNRVNIYACDKSEEVSLLLNDAIDTDVIWARYLVGLIREFYKLGFKFNGFDCLFFSEVPIGAGVSSSAALQCGFVLGIDKLCQARLEKWDLVHLCNRSDNQFMGVQSGILDQFSSLFGKEGKAMLMDCDDHSFQYYNLELAPYKLVLINTKVNHSNLTSGYNDRPAECQKVLEIAKTELEGISTMRDIDNLKLDQLKSKLSVTLYDRASFVIEENKRVQLFKEAIENRDVSKLGALLYSSHKGLKEQYEVSCQELDLLVDHTRPYEEIKGARMMGGGFGGCTINLVHQENMTVVINEIMEAYERQTNIEPEVYYVLPSQGAELH